MTPPRAPDLRLSLTEVVEAGPHGLTFCFRGGFAAQLTASSELPCRIGFTRRLPRFTVAHPDQDISDAG
jgi:hypothetical protein